MSSVSKEELLGCIDERPEEGVLRIDRKVFTDEKLFDLEMKAIFEGSWIFLAHESQISQPNDFFSTRMGRQPVLITRDGDGKIRVMINACRHRGSTVCQMTKGNAKSFTCPFHGWVYGSNGDLIAAADEKKGAYPASFDRKKLGLTQVPKVESYRGFIFASLSDDVPPLDEHLGDVRTFIDQIVDQAPLGLEILKGNSSYTYNGNWKHQIENGVDGYHLAETHKSYMMTVARRMEINAGRDQIKAMDVRGVLEMASGYFAMDNGHVMIWGDWPGASQRPNYPHLEEFKKKFGDVRGDWMVNKLRNVAVYPNVFLMDQMSSQIRVIKPLSFDRTEITIYCIAPIGEEPEVRNHRIRQYEDFFNASGMATSDDLAAFNACQDGAGGRASPWSDMSRGATRRIEGPDQHASALGISPAYCGPSVDDEGIYFNQHNRWLELMLKHVDGA